MAKKDVEAPELTQIRIEHIILVAQSPEDLDELTSEIMDEVADHLDKELGEQIILTIQTPMSEVDEHESERLQNRLEESYGSVGS